MKSVIVVCLLLATALTFTIDDKVLVASPSQLRFNNYTGPGVNRDMLDNFNNFVESASAFYKDDVKANEVYIAEQMDKKYGSSDRNFFVHIQTEQAVPFSWLCWVTTDNTIATRSGINKIHPDWSYMFIKFIAPPYSDDYSFITAGKQGDGIDEDTLNVISNLVNQYETGDQCSCDNTQTSNIAYGLINGSGRAFSTICDASGVTNSLVNTVDDLWVSVKPKNCWYTFYVSQ